MKYFTFLLVIFTTAATGSEYYGRTHNSLHHQLHQDHLSIHRQMHHQQAPSIYTPYTYSGGQNRVIVPVPQRNTPSGRTFYPPRR